MKYQTYLGFRISRGAPFSPLERLLWMLEKFQIMFSANPVEQAFFALGLLNYDMKVI